MKKKRILLEMLVLLYNTSPTGYWLFNKLPYWLTCLIIDIRSKCGYKDYSGFCNLLLRGPLFIKLLPDDFYMVNIFINHHMPPFPKGHMYFGWTPYKWYERKKWLRNIIENETIEVFQWEREYYKQKQIKQ